jgi:hypothetical protein
MVSSGLFVFFLNCGFQRYGELVDFKEDDIARFERILYASTVSVSESLDIVKSLVEQYKFVPIRGFGSPVDETVYVSSGTSH